jgi:LuxR family transcriptional regulator, maltose regulon positive regulatory protein
MMRLTRASLKNARTLLQGCHDPGLSQKLPAVAMGSTRAALTPGYEGASVGAELTRKELEVLRLLGTGLSRREIGAQLYVSLNTVKTHHRALYRKLEVESRGAAVSRASELGLL